MIEKIIDREEIRHSSLMIDLTRWINDIDSLEKKKKKNSPSMRFVGNVSLLFVILPPIDGYKGDKIGIGMRVQNGSFLDRCHS